MSYSFQGSLRTIGSGVAWGGPGRFRTPSHIEFRVPGSKVPEVGGCFGGSRGFECAILDDVEVWRCGKLGRFGRYWRCISGWFGDEGFRGLRGIGKSMDDSGSFGSEDSRFFGRFGGFRRSWEVYQTFARNWKFFFWATDSSAWRGTSDVSEGPRSAGSRQTCKADSRNRQSIRFRNRCLGTRLWGGAVTGFGKVPGRRLHQVR